jgi:type III secretion protein C
MKLLRVSALVGQMLLVLALGFWVLTGSIAAAAPIPWSDRQIPLTVRELPIKTVLENLCASEGIPVQVSAAVTGSLSAQFNDKPQRIFDRVVRTYSLLPYFDGAVLHVFTSSEAKSRTLVVSPGVVDKYVELLRQLGLFDSRNSFRIFPATGVIVLTGAPRFVEQAAEIAGAVQLLGEDGKSTFRAFRLKHASAVDTQVTAGGRQITIPGVASVLRSLISSSDRNRTYLDGSGVKPIKSTQEKLRGKGLSQVGRATQESEQTGNDPSADSSPGKPGGVSTAGASARIEADPRLNAILIRDAAERMPYYEQLIATLDVEAVQVEIQATLVDLNVDRLQELGINWRLESGRFEWLFGNGSASDETLRPGAVVTSAARGLAVSTILGSNANFVARIKALSAQGAAEIVSSPQLLTVENVEAVLESTRSFYVRVAGKDEVDLFNVSVGTVLRVTPYVVPAVGGKQRLRLVVQIDDGSVSEQSVDAIPIVDKMSISVQNIIADGESLLIGGLVRQQRSKSEDKVPLLGDIPIFGHLFRSTAQKSARSERLFLLTPRIIDAGNIPARLRRPQFVPADPSPMPVPSPIDRGTPRPALPNSILPNDNSLKLPSDVGPSRDGPVPNEPASPPKRPNGDLSPDRCFTHQECSYLRG